MARGDVVETIITGTADNAWWLPEHHRCHGPETIGNVGTGTLAETYGYEWRLELDRTDYVLKVYKYQSLLGLWTQSNYPITCPFDLRKIRHISIAFDKNGQPVIALELKGNIYIRQYAGMAQGFVWRGPFAGHDPTLIEDGTCHKQLDDGSVWLYHTTLARDMVVKRDAQDQFTIPYITVTDSPSIPVPCYVLGAFSIDNQLRVAVGNFDQVNVIDILEVFPPPPINLTDQPLISGQFSNGEVFDWVIQKDIQDSVLLDTSYSGLEFEAVVTKDFADSLLIDTSYFGEDKLIIVSIPDMSDQPLISGLLVIGSEDVIVLPVETNDAALADGGFSNGTEV